MKKTKIKFDSRNKLNNLDGKSWIKATKSFYFSEKSIDDKDAFAHPAPFLIKDVKKMIEMFTKKGMTVLDPFVGSGTTLLACYESSRKGIGIDLNENYYCLAKKRFDKKLMKEGVDYKYIIGDSLIEVSKIKKVDFIITSPPYHNILHNNSKGIRVNKSKKGFRSGSRTSVEVYSNMANDLGNQKTYNGFLKLFQQIMKKCYVKLNSEKYCVVIISDFTVDKKEVCVQADIVKTMEKIGYCFCGTIILLQDCKPLYPFGYPYAFKINHMHQNIIIFRKK